MKTRHTIHFQSCLELRDIESDSVDLIVTSPPYPLIQMWDHTFSEQDPLIKKALMQNEGMKAFELMHRLLDSVWSESYRVLKPGGFVCLNIGDATRTMNGHFALYPNHMRILKSMLEIGFTSLPCILWRKQTNAPNKFMGSGMLPAGAYVTLEHEYILVLRKGAKREFIEAEDKKRRRESALFWEERNVWFSDVWFDIKGTVQTLNHTGIRQRSGAYPFEVVYRLINMYSVRSDTVLDPFLGTGTTVIASIVSGRNSIGYEIDRPLRKTILQALDGITDYADEYQSRRIRKHLSFIEERIENDKPLKHINQNYGFPVVTSQEKDILFPRLVSLEKRGKNVLEALYSGMIEVPEVVTGLDKVILKNDNAPSPRKKVTF